MGSSGKKKTTKYLFVNKSSSSEALTRSSSEERNTILSHVQNRRRREEKGKHPAEPWERFASSMTLGEEEDAAESRQRSPSLPQLVPVTSLEYRLPHTYPSDNAFDPFHSTVAGTDARSHAVLNCSLLCLAKFALLTEAFATWTAADQRTWNRHDETLNERLRCCVDNEMLMYSTLAYGSSLLAWMVGLVDEKKPPDYYYGKAIEAVRARLSDSSQKTDRWLLISVYSLAITELWGSTRDLWIRCPSMMAKADARRLQASRLHLRALNTLVESSGGWADADPYVKDCAVLADKYLAIREMTPPILPLTWDPGYFGRESQMQISVDAIPLLGKSLLRVSMSDQLEMVVRDVINYVRVASHIWSLSDMTRDDEQWLFLRFQALACRLLFLDKLHPHDNCVRFAVLIFLLNTTHHLGSQVAAASLLKQLKKALSDAEDWETGFDGSLCFWCLCVGALVPEQSAEKVWFISQLSTLSHRLLLKTTEDDYRQMLEPYLFLADKQGPYLSILIDDLTTSSATSAEEGF